MARKPIGHIVYLSNLELPAFATKKPSWRFIARGVRLSEFLEILENAEEHWPGLTRFVHDGHSQSSFQMICCRVTVLRRRFVSFCVLLEG